MTDEQAPARYLIHWRDANGDDEGVAPGGPHTVADGWIAAQNKVDRGKVVWWLEKVQDGAEALTGYEEDPQTEPMRPVMKADRPTEEPRPVVTVEEVVKAVESDPELAQKIAAMAAEYMSREGSIGH